MLRKLLLNLKLLSNLWRTWLISIGGILMVGLNYTAESGQGATEDISRPRGVNDIGHRRTGDSSDSGGSACRVFTHEASVFSHSKNNACGTQRTGKRERADWCELLGHEIGSEITFEVLVG